MTHREWLEVLPEPIWKRLEFCHDEGNLTEIYEDEIASLRDFLIPNIEGKVFYDCGAFNGIWSIVAAMSGAKEVHLFEPNKDQLNRAVRNLTVNDLPPYYTCNKPLWNKVERVHFDGWYLRGVTENQNVEAETLDSYGGAPDFIKVDVEGKEVEVLEGAKELISRYHPLLMIEDHKFNIGSNEEEVLSRFPGYHLGAPIIERSNSRHLFLRFG